jgi:hypothetical protein
MCKVIGILKIIPQHKNGCLQRGANGKNVNHVLMKQLIEFVQPNQQLFH